MSTKVVLATALCTAALTASAPAHAGTEFPFVLDIQADTFEGSEPYNSIRCDGPWLRTSDCHQYRGLVNTEFYRAEDTIFSAIGKWTCRLYVDPGPGLECSDHTTHEATYTVEFCGPGVGGAPNEVKLTFFVDLPLRTPHFVGNQSDLCPSATVTSVLGHDGEDARSADKDIDVFDFPGEAGETVEVVLDRDGSAGSTGEVATLRVLDQASETVLGEQTGALPLTLEVGLLGPVAITVKRPRSDEGNVPFHGHYALAVTPTTGDLSDRLLAPQENVEQ